MAIEINEDPLVPPTEETEDMYAEPIGRIYDGFSPTEQEYYKKNPDLLPARLRMERLSELQTESPDAPIEVLYGQAYDELDKKITSPSVDTSAPMEATPIVPIQSVPQNTDSWFKRINVNLPARAGWGLVSGGIDFGIEATSGVARALDYLVESAGYDLIDDNDSWFYDMKEGLSEETKESIKSFGGWFPKGDTIVEGFLENLGTIVLGSYVIGAAAATGVGVRLAGYAAGTRAGGAVAGFLGKHKTLAKVAQLGLDGARMDVSALMFSDPGTVFSLLGVGDSERAAAFAQWYNSFDPITRRAENLAEGIFMNVLWGAVVSRWNRPKQLEYTGMQPQQLGGPTEIPQLTFKDDQLLLPNGTRVSGEEVYSELHKLYIRIQKGLEDVTDVTPADISRTVDAPFDPIKAYEGMLGRLRTTVDEAVSGPDALTRTLARTETVVDFDDLRFTPTETVWDTADIRFLDTEVVFDNTGKIKNSTVILEQATPETKVAVVKAQKIAENTPEISEREVLASEAAVEKMIVAESDEVVNPVVINKDMAKWYATVGSPDKSMGIRFNSPIEGYLWSKIKGFINKGALTKSDLNNMSWDKLPEGLTKAQAKASAQKLFEGVTAAIQRTNTKVTYKEALESLEKVTVKIDPEDISKSIIDNGAVISESRVRKAEAAGETRDNILAGLTSKRGRRGSTMFFAPGAMEEIFKHTGRTTLSVLKVAAAAANRTGLVGGTIAGFISNQMGIDVNQDGEVNLKDMATVTAAWMGLRYIGTFKANQELTAELASRDALVTAMKRGQQDFHRTLLMARSMASRVATSSVDQIAIDNAKKTVKYLEDYLFSTKEGLEEIIKHPAILTSLRNRTLVISNEAINNLRLSLQGKLRDKTTPLVSGSSIDIDRFDFGSPESVTKAFDDSMKVFLGVTQDPKVSAGILNNSQSIKKATTDLLNEFEIPQTVADSTWLNKPFAEQAAMVHTARSFLGAIDDGIRTFVKQTTDLSPQQLHEFIGLVNQRRAVGEYLRSGGRIGPRLTTASGHVSRSALMSTMPETFLRGLRDYKQVAETYGTLRALMAANPSLSGVNLTKLVDSVGANMTMGQMALQAQYMALFSHPLTWLKPAIENTIGTTVGLTSNALAAIMRGQFYDEIVGPHGMLQGIIKNLGSTVELTKNKALGEALGMLTAGGKEFTDMKFAYVLSKAGGLEDPNFVNLVFRKFMNVMGLDPTDLVSTFDVFFKSMAFHGLENQRVVQEALDLLRKPESKGMTFDQAVANIRLDDAAMGIIRQEALDGARKLTYTDDIFSEATGTTKSVVEALHHPVTRLLFPILRTPLVAARFAIRHTPFTLGLVGEDRRAFASFTNKKIKGATIDATLTRRVNDIGARNAVGLATSFGIYSVINEMGWEVIGTGEYDPAFKAKQARGARQFGLWNSKTGEFISLERFSLYKMTLGVLADAVHYSNRDQTKMLPEERDGAMATVGYIAYSVLTQAQPEQVDNLKRLLGGHGGAYERTKEIASNEYGALLGRLIPTVFKSEGRASDPYRRAWLGPWESAIQAIYQGWGRGESLRPTLDLYGNRVENSRSLLSYKGVPEGDELYREAEAAGYDLNGMLKRRSSIGGVRLGSSQEEQALAYKAEKYHGETLAKYREPFLKELRSTPDAQQKKELFSRLFRSISLDVKSKLSSDPELGETVRRLLRTGGRR